MIGGRIVEQVAIQCRAGRRCAGLYHIALYESKIYVSHLCFPSFTNDIISKCCGPKGDTGAQGPQGEKGDPGSDATVTVDSALSSTSTNPVQNKVINAALAQKQAALTAGDNIAIDDDTGKISVSGILSASNIPNLDASKITSGILPVSNGGTGSSTAKDALFNLNKETSTKIYRQNTTYDWYLVTSLNITGSPNRNDILEASILSSYGISNASATLRANLRYNSNSSSGIFLYLNVVSHKASNSLSDENIAVFVNGKQAYIFLRYTTQYQSLVIQQINTDASSNVDTYNNRSWTFYGNSPVDTGVTNVDDLAATYGTKQTITFVTDADQEWVNNTALADYATQDWVTNTALQSYATNTAVTGLSDKINGMTVSYVYDTLNDAEAALTGTDTKAQFKLGDSLFIKDTGTPDLWISGQTEDGEWETSELESKFNADQYYDTTTIDGLLAGKQDTLTAGDNISISNGVISATAPTLSINSEGHLIASYPD